MTIRRGVPGNRLKNHALWRKNSQWSLPNKGTEILFSSVRTKILFPDPSCKMKMRLSKKGFGMRVDKMRLFQCAKAAALKIHNAKGRQIQNKFASD